jgi:predicted DNA binding CopG/RHH family protein
MATESFVCKASTEHEKALDDEMSFHITMRLHLQRSLFDDLCDLASEDGLGYKPYIRRLLKDHVRNEKRKRGKDV